VFSMQRDSLAQRLGPFFGLLYATIGVLGFLVTGFGNVVQNTGDTLIGFHINPMHNLAHLLIGVFLIAMSTRRDVAVAEGAVLGVALLSIGLISSGQSQASLKRQGLTA